MLDRDGWYAERGGEETREKKKKGVRARLEKGRKREKKEGAEGSFSLITGERRRSGIKENQISASDAARKE